MIDTFQIFEELKKDFPESTAKKLTDILSRIYVELANTVTKEDFRGLKEIIEDLINTQKSTEKEIIALKASIAELSEAQRKTEERVRELVDAQKRAEERVNEFERRTEENFQRVWKSIAELSEAQKRTEEEIEKLRATVAEIAEDLKRLTKSHLKLVEEHRKTREQLGGLSHTVGYLLEDRAYVGLPSLLKKDFNLEIIEPLKRDYIETSPGVYEEVNIIGKGKINGKEVFIIGECKTQLKKKDVDKFLSFVRKLSKYLFKDTIAILVTYQTSPKVRKYAKEKGIKLYFSYEFPLA